MKKHILNLEGAKSLNKDEQKTISGGMPAPPNCTGGKIPCYYPWTSWKWRCDYAYNCPLP